MLNHVEGTSYTDSIATQATFWSGKLLGNKAYGPIGAKPARASTFIRVYKQLNANALAGIAKSARASVSNSIDTLMNAEAFAGFVPKGP